LPQQSETAALRQRGAAARAKGNLNDDIGAISNAHNNADEAIELNEYGRWLRDEHNWMREQLEETGNVIKYWWSLRPKYPNFAHLAIDILSIPASGCDCERGFSDLGDLLEPKRRKLGSQLLAALQCVHSWLKAGFNAPSDKETARLEALVTTEELNSQYSVCNRDKIA
jgi:hypothetical protein